MTVALQLDSPREDQAMPLLARIAGLDGSNLTQALVGSIALEIYRKEADGSYTQTHTDTLDKTAVIFDVLQTGSGWSVDGTGYNFSHTIPASAWDQPDQYWIEVRITDSSGNLIPVVVEDLPVKPLQGS
jgi:hypothetical protein